MASTPVDLTGRVVAITGAARGIGHATALACARAGMKVAIGDLDTGGAERAAAGLPAEAIGLHLDVTDLKGFTHFLDQVEERLGPLDVLVNNAGIMPIGAFEDETEETVVRQLEINLHAVIHGTKDAMRRMRPRGRGHIVNIASAAGKAGFPGGATYCACKFGVVGLSEAVRGELRDTGVGVSVVMPGIVNTELASGLQEGRGVKRVEPEEVADSIVDALRTGRFEVYVPKSIGPINAFMRLFPTRAREAVGRALKADRVLAHADSSARAAYEARAAASAPAAEEHMHEQEPVA